MGISVTLWIIMVVIFILGCITPFALTLLASLAIALITHYGMTTPYWGIDVIVFFATLLVMTFARHASGGEGIDFGDMVSDIGDFGGDSSSDGGGD